MNDFEYNLLDENWINVMTTKGEWCSVGLLELFDNAHEYRSLAGDCPTQDFALLRLLIAILYQVHQVRDASGNESPLETIDDAEQRWSEIWNEGRFNGHLFREYLERYRNRFYLFHPDHPFYQVPIGQKATFYPASKLRGELSESGNKVRLFSSVGTKAKQSLGYAEAARWLLHLNGYDDTAAKPSVSKSDMPSPGIGWLGKIGSVYVEGGNLFETMMLNFVLADEYEEPLPTGETPWELDQPRMTERVKIPAPESPSEVLTLQSRRILLEREGDRVIGCLLLGGDIIPTEDCLIEQMTAWRLSKEGHWIPKQHDPAKSLWRDYQSILIKSTGDQQSRKPGVLEWVSRDFIRKYLPYEDVSLRAVGIKYGRDISSTILDFVDDGLVLNRGLLSEKGTGWNIRISAMVEDTEKCIYRLSRFHQNALMSEGCDKELLKARSASSKEECYSLLDFPFRRWLASIDPSTSDEEEVTRQWLNTLEKVVLSVGRSIVMNCNSQAMVGRTVEKDKPLNIFIAYSWFVGSVYAITRM